MKKHLSPCPHGHVSVLFPVSFTADGAIQESRKAGRYCLIGRGTLGGEGSDAGLPSAILAHRAICQRSEDWFEVWDGRVMG